MNGRLEDTGMAEEIDPIPPEQARDILEAAIRELLGDN
jgi:hypothetical protein